MIILDFVWAFAECGVAIMSALVEGYISTQYTVNNTGYSKISYYNWWYIFIANKGAFAVAAVSFIYYFTSLFKK